MALPQHAVTLSSEQIAELDRKLAELRHNINNHLGLMVAAAELTRVKPETAARMHDSMMAQPERIINELRNFSKELHKYMQVSDDENGASS